MRLMLVNPSLEQRSLLMQLTMNIRVCVCGPVCVCVYVCVRVAQGAKKARGQWVNRTQREKDVMFKLNLYS